MESIDNYILPEITTSYDSQHSAGEYKLPENSFVFAIQQKQEINFIQGELSNFTENIFDVLQENSSKEIFYVKAIKNILKQKEYINLLYQVSNDLITEEDFNTELDKNEEKYLINVDNELDNSNYKVIANVISKIGNNFTDDDILEIFSLSTNNIDKFLLSNNEE